MDTSIQPRAYARCPVPFITSTHVECQGGCGYSWYTYEQPVKHTVCEDCLFDRYICLACNKAPVLCECPSCPCLDDVVDPAKTHQLEEHA